MIQKEHLIKEDLLRERIRNDLSQTMSSEDINEITEFLLSEAATEGEASKEDYNPFTKKAWTGAGQMKSDIKAADLKTAAGRLETAGELILWCVDAIPNLYQALRSIPDSEVGGATKALRIVSRIFGVAFIPIGKTLVKAADLLRKSPPAVQAVLSKVVGGDWGDEDTKQLGKAAAGAAADQLAAR